MSDLKNLGLALGAILAIGAMAASVGQADTLTAEKYPVTLTGDNDAHADTFTSTLGVPSCKKRTITAYC
jgi:uncharacterized membrane protein